MTEDLALIREYGKVINDNQLRFPVDRQLDCSQFFQAKDYKTLRPGEGASEERRLKALQLHYENFPEAFDFDDGFYEDKMHVLRIDGHGIIKVAASFVIIQAGRDLLCYLALLKTMGKYRKKGLGSQVVADIREFLEQEIKGKKYDSCYIAANIDAQYRPDGFFKHNGFSKDAPARLKSWKEGQCQLVVLKVFDVEDPVEHQPAKGAKQSKAQHQAPLRGQLPPSGAQMIGQRRSRAIQKIVEDASDDSMVDEEDEDDEDVEEVKPKQKAGKIPKASKKAVATSKAATATKKRSVKQEEKKDKVLEKADGASDRSKDRHAAKHCMEPGCLKKRISQNWALHVFREHGNKAANDVQFTSCYGGDCCKQGKFYFSIGGDFPVQWW